MKLVAHAAPWLPILLLTACAQVPRPAPPPVPAPIAAPAPPSSTVTALAAAGASLVRDINAYGEVEASFIYEGRSPFGHGLRSRTQLDAKLDGCRMTLSRAIRIWASDRRESDAQRETEAIVIDLRDVDARSIVVAKAGGYRQAAGYAVTSKYLGNTVEIRFGAPGGAVRFRFAGKSEPTMAEVRFMLNDSLVGAQVAKALMQAVELCQPPATASSAVGSRPR